MRQPFVQLSTVWALILGGERRTETWQFSTVNDFSIQIVTMARHDWSKAAKLGKRFAYSLRPNATQLKSASGFAQAR